MAVFSMAGSNPALPTYPLQRSVRLRSSASASFSRTPATAGNRKTWTWSGWVKRGQLGIVASLVSANFNTAGGLHFVYFTTTDTLNCYIELTVGIKTLWTTNAVFRDPSAWYHIVVVFDTTQAAVANMCKFYVNGALQSATISNVSATYISQNADGWINNNTAQYLGSGQSAYTYYYDGYPTEVNFIDGQALTPSSFGAYNSYGVWSPAKYTGTYGTNGFYLNFQDNSALTTTANVGIGKDSSGNGNYWTSNNISITAGTTYDSMLDVPTLTSATNANFATLSPLQVTAASIGTLSNANLSWSCGASGTYGKVYGTMSLPSTGQYYWEVTAGSTANLEIGIISASDQTTFYPGYSAVGYTYYQNTGNKTNNNVSTAYGASYTTNDVIGVAFDATAGTLTFYKNNVSQGTAFTSLTGTYVPTLGNQASGASTSASINFGQRPFTYTPPTGFNRLCTYNLPDSIVPVGAQYMAATTFTGNGATQSITNTVNGKSLQPDMVWLKSRSISGNPAIYDSVRGLALLTTSSTNAEVTAPAGNDLTAYNSNGFTLGPVFYITPNTNGATSVGWRWRASNASAVTNTAGTITSQVSANQTAGFSIVTYTGTGANATVGHGLGVAPKMVIIKGRTTTYDWRVWFTGFPTGYDIQLNQTAAYSSAPTVYTSAPTSTVINIGTGLAVNQSAATYVAYCFAAVPGYSAFGSYTGNASTDGPFVYTGMRPRWVLIKRSDGISNWIIYDTSRNTYNTANSVLFPDSTSAEATGYEIDILSNGFKIKYVGGNPNISGATYIYAAFAENPFKNALAR